MIDYSEIVIVFLMLPVVMQIIFPLLMLVGYFLLRTLSGLIGLNKVSRLVEKMV